MRVRVRVRARTRVRARVRARVRLRVGARVRVYYVLPTFAKSTSFACAVFITFMYASSHTLVMGRARGRGRVWEEG